MFTDSQIMERIITHCTLLDFLMAYARVLRGHRKDLGLSQEELAFRAG